MSLFLAKMLIGKQCGRVFTLEHPPSGVKRALLLIAVNLVSARGSMQSKAPSADFKGWGGSCGGSSNSLTTSSILN